MRCYDTGRKYFSRNFVLFAARRPDADHPWRLGMAVTRKTGNAVRRNRVRRLLRECFRCNQHLVPGGYDYVVVPKRHLDPGTLCLARVTQELVPLLGIIGTRPDKGRQA